MIDTSELPPIDLQGLRDTISRSQIYLRHAELAARLADWKRVRLSADVDAVVLAWIASHVTGPRASALS